jgi:sugar O-acyltransferase (sialic acid O-acetyltransferase NeuD family)
MKPQLNTSSVVVYGGSGQGKVVVDILRACGIEPEGFIDDDPLQCGELPGLKKLGDGNWLITQAASRSVAVALGIGDNFDRRRIAERSAAIGIPLITAVHPSATVAESATLSSGVVVMAQAVVNPGASIGLGTIINTGAVIEHDCSVGDFAHISPKAAIGGNVQVGDLSWLGIAAAAIPGVKIGAGCIVGAGATVVRDVDDWLVVVGTPARVLKKITPRN